MSEEIGHIPSPVCLHIKMITAYEASFVQPNSGSNFLAVQQNIVALLFVLRGTLHTKGNSGEAVREEGQGPRLFCGFLDVDTLNGFASEMLSTSLANKISHSPGRVSETLTESMY